MGSCGIFQGPNRITQRVDSTSDSRIATCTSDRLAINAFHGFGRVGNSVDSLTEFRKGFHCLSLIHNSGTNRGKALVVRAWWVEEEWLSCHFSNKGFLNTVFRDADGGLRHEW